MDRIIDEKVSATASERWDGLVPKVLKIAEAEAENNSNIKMIIEELGDKLEEGKQVHIHFRFILWVRTSVIPLCCCVQMC